MKMTVMARASYPLSVVRRLSWHGNRRINRRSFSFEYLKDVLRTRSLSPTNPVLHSIQQVLQKDQSSYSIHGGTAEGPSTTSAPPTGALPDLTSDVRPYHLEKAAEQIFQDFNKSFLSTDKEPNNADPQSLPELLSIIDSSKAPVIALERVSSLCWLLADRIQEQSFRRALDGILLESRRRDGLRQFSQRVVDCLEKQARGFEPQQNDESLRAAKYLMQTHVNDTAHLNLPPEAQRQFQDLSEALEDVEITLQDDDLLSRLSTQEIVREMYNLIGIRTEQAKMLGHSSFADWTFQSEPRLASIEQIDALHSSIRKELVPWIQTLEAFRRKETTSLEDYLSSPETRQPSTPKTTELSAERQDELSMIILEQHVTLEGALLFLQRLIQDLFGLSMTRDEAFGSGQNQEVQLWHVHNHEDGVYVGSFYLDPFIRQGKAGRSFTNPLYVRGQSVKSGRVNQPVLYVSLAIEPPAWDTDVPVLSWDDAEALFHELGHMVDYIMSTCQYGTIAGFESYPFDRTELVPKFMEHFLRKKETVYALIHLSESKVGFSDDSIEAAFRTRARQKAMHIAQQAFYGSLELYLMSSRFDIRGEESIIAVQNRMAIEYCPYDVPDKKNVAPLLGIMRENASGHKVSWYRYLFCDVVSANVFFRMEQAYTSENKPTSSENELKEMIRQGLLVGSTTPVSDGIDRLDLDPRRLLEQCRV